MSHQKVDSSFDPWLARVPRRPSESPVQSSRAPRTSVSTSPRPRAGAGLTHSPVTSTAPPGTTPTSRPTGGKAQGGPWLQQQETLSLPVGQVKGSTRSLCPPSSATRTTASSTGVPGQMVLMNAIDTWNTFGGQHSLALHPDTPKCLPCLPSTPPPPNPALNAGRRNKVEVRAGPQIPPAHTSFPRDWTCTTFSPGTFPSPDSPSWKAD